MKLEDVDENTWRRHCKLTAEGGSERGECSCEHPLACELQDHPDFPADRRTRIDRWMETRLRDMETRSPEKAKLARALHEALRIAGSRVPSRGRGEKA
jgi:hypothetical protein